MISFDPGLIIWTTIIFTLLLIVLKKYAWKPILTAVDERNKSITEALKAADKAKEEITSLNADNERILQEARMERDLLLKEARDMKNNIISKISGTTGGGPPGADIEWAEATTNNSMQALWQSRDIDQSRTKRIWHS